MKKPYNNFAEREKKLDEIRKEQADRKEKEFEKEIEKYSTEAQKSFWRSTIKEAIGLAVFVASAFVVKELPFASAATVGNNLLFLGAAAIGVFNGSMLFRHYKMKNRINKLANENKRKMQEEIQKMREIEDNNRDADRYMRKLDIISLRKALKLYESKADPADTEYIEYLKDSITKRGVKLRESSPARRELARQLRPELAKRLYAEKKLVKQ